MNKYLVIEEVVWGKEEPEVEEIYWITEDELEESKKEFDSGYDDVDEQETYTTWSTHGGGDWDDPDAWYTTIYFDGKAKLEQLINIEVEESKKRISRYEELLGRQ